MSGASIRNLVNYRQPNFKREIEGPGTEREVLDITGGWLAVEAPRRERDPASASSTQRGPGQAEPARLPHEGRWYVLSVNSTC